MLIFNSTIPHTAEIGKGTRAQAVGAPVVEDDVFLGTNAILQCERIGKN